MTVVDVKDARNHYHLGATIDANGALVLSAHDLSSWLPDVLGTDEYEYWYTVEAPSVPGVCAGLQVGPEAVLEAVRDLLAAHGLDASRVWKEWLVARAIPYAFSTWRS